ELPLQPLNRRRFFASMARPFGLWPGASGQRLTIFSESASNSAISLELRMLTKMCPLPSATAASGSPPKAIVPATVSEAGPVEVEDHHAVPPGDVEPAGVGVDREVIPASLAADRDLSDLRRGRGRAIGDGLRRQGREQRGADEQRDRIHRCRSLWFRWFIPGS